MFARIMLAIPLLLLGTLGGAAQQATKKWDGRWNLAPSFTLAPPPAPTVPYGGKNFESLSTSTANPATGYFCQSQYNGSYGVMTWQQGSWSTGGPTCRWRSGPHTVGCPAGQVGSRSIYWWHEAKPKENTSRDWEQQISSSCSTWSDPGDPCGGNGGRGCDGGGGGN